MISIDMLERWIRALPLAVVLVACKQPGDVTVHQYDTVAAPVVGHGVKLYLGDVELGRHAEVRVTAPDGNVLGVGELEVGDELPFAHRGERYVVRAVRYEDHTIDDLAVLRVARQASSSRAGVVEIAEAHGAPVPGRPDDVITVGAIVLNSSVDIDLRLANGDTRSQSLWVGDAAQVTDDQGGYALILVAVTFGPDGVDRATLRFRPGRE